MQIYLALSAQTRVAILEQAQVHVESAHTLVAILEHVQIHLAQTAQVRAAWQVCARALVWVSCCLRHRPSLVDPAQTTQVRVA